MLATNAHSVRSFSALCRLITWLRTATNVAQHTQWTLQQESYKTLQYSWPCTEYSAHTQTHTVSYMKQVRLSHLLKGSLQWT